jgi:hypothetical protein
MKIRSIGILVLTAVLALVAAPAAKGQIALTGEIAGIVTDGGGEALPGVAVTLRGEKLFQRSLAALTNEKGAFRFLNLNPGEYELEFTLQGFDAVKLSAAVSVGKASSLHVKMAPAGINKEIVVKAEPPLIETKTAQLSTNYSNALVQQIPTSRNAQDLMDATPAVNDKGAYGAGARVRKDYYKGSSANAYLLNGVDISDLSTGATWVNPNYDTIEEIQVVGVGATAEFGNFTGAALNIITKTGTNKIHGGLSTYFTNKSLFGDNSDGVVDLTPAEYRYDSESTAYLSGPLVPEKLFFFISGGYTGIQSRRYGEPAYGTYKQPHFQANVNWLPSTRHSLTFMINFDPLNHDNLGLLPGSGPEISYSRKFVSTVWNASWRFLVSDSSIFELKYAGFHGHDKTDPASPDTASIQDASVNRAYGSSGTVSDYLRDRNQVNASWTQYLDDFLGASHEIKVGLEYESSKATDDARATGPGASLFQIVPYSGLYWVLGYEGYSANTKAELSRFAGFLQDNVQIGKRLSLNVGLRFDAPRLTSPGVTDPIVQYKNIAPRLGLSYDFSGAATSVLHLGFGRYYDKIVTEGFGYAMPGMGSIKLYSLFMTSPFVPTQANIDALPGLVNRPENLFYTMSSADLYGVDPEINSPYSDVFNARFEQQLLSLFAVSLEYVHKEDRNFIRVMSSTAHTYQEIQWTDPYLGRTIPVWGRTDYLPDVWSYTNSTWGRRKHDMVILTLRTRQTGNWSLMSSFVYQNSRGNDDNTSGPVGYNFNQDLDPNYTQNPLIWGHLTFDRTYQFKMLGTYLLPWGFNISGDLHILSGTAWQPLIDYQFTGLYDGAISKIMLEQRGNRRMPWTWTVNLRLSKEFSLGGASHLELMADVFNVFNRANADSISPEPYAVFPLSGKSAFGQVFLLSNPINVRFGARWMF